MGVHERQAAELLLQIEGTETPLVCHPTVWDLWLLREPSYPRGLVGSDAVLKRQSRDYSSVWGPWDLHLRDQIPKRDPGGLHRALEHSFPK